MASTLLSTKLHIPAHRPGLVPRPHLIERLEAGLRGKLTLVSAPAGFGKTTALSEWVRYRDQSVAWLSLDKNDNELLGFLTYLIAALQRIDGDIGVDIQSVLEESLSPQFDILLTRLVSEIECIQDKFIAVLDDYHLIDSKPVHDALNFLIEYLPPSMHLVVLGRADPPLPISRLRVQGEVNEIRTPDLRFTKSEMIAFLNDLMGFNLSSKDIDTLERRTEGWIASLQLAALSMQGQDDRQAFIADFSGSHRYIIDYLVDEVMRQHPEDVQLFLMRTSILERFCSSLCEVVIGGDGIKEQSILDYLDRANLFLIPLDDHREWYRYHHLFADFLEQRLGEVEAQHIPELHRRASQWYESQGLVDEAIQHALVGGDQDSAIRLVDEIAPDLVVRRESNKLLKLVEQLPADRCQAFPMLCLWHAWALLFLGQLDKVEPVLEIVEANQKQASRIPIPGYVSTIRAYLANQRGHLEQAIDLSERALDLLSSAQTERITLIFRGAIIIWLGVNHRLLGDLDRASQLFVEAASLNHEAGNFYGVLAAIEQSAELAVLRGQLHHAEEINRQGLLMASKWTEKDGRGRGTSVAAAGPHLGLGAVLYQWNDLKESAPHLQRAMELLEMGEAWGRMFSYKMLAYNKLAEGDYEGSYDLLRKANTIRGTISVRQSNIADQPSLDQLGIMLSRAHSDLAYLLTDAIQRIENLGIQSYDEVDFTSPVGYRQESDYTDLSRMLIEQGRADDALPLIERLLQAAHSMGRYGDEIRYLILKALAFHALGDQEFAKSSLMLALQKARPEGYVRIFVDEGQPMAELLHMAILQDINPVYAHDLLTAFPEDMQGAVKTEMEPVTITKPLIEPLSEREIEVLRLMAGGYKYKEIADRMVISINTVRHHNRNIFSKLNVNSRVQAIARARELNLL